MLSLLSEKFPNYREKALKNRLSNLGNHVKIGRVLGVKIGFNDSSLIATGFGNGDNFSHLKV
jgi:hypothetical protein